MSANENENEMRGTNLRAGFHNTYHSLVGLSGRRLMVDGSGLWRWRALHASSYSPSTARVAVVRCLSERRIGKECVDATVGSYRVLSKESIGCCEWGHDAGSYDLRG
ncbi:hypothetical protein HKD37_03G007789 [Glycine soja]